LDHLGANKTGLELGMQAIYPWHNFRVGRRTIGASDLNSNGTERRLSEIFYEVKAQLFTIYLSKDFSIY
jgi:hypothetical protein